MKINSVEVNNRKKGIEIETSKGRFFLPFSKLCPIPSTENKIKSVFVDKELGSEAITYVLESGLEESNHLDAFLDYNRDPEHFIPHYVSVIAAEVTVLHIPVPYHANEPEHRCEQHHGQ